MSALKIVFAGTPVFAARHLTALLDAGHHLAGVYTQPDRAAGRGKKLLASPVKQLAESRQIRVFQPASLKTDAAQSELAALQPDLMVVVAYGLLLPLPVLEIPQYGCINVHASLLPRWRGAAPIERAILAGDTETGITIMQMDVGLDTGAMLYTRSTPIAADDDRLSLENRLAELGCEALLATLARLQELRSTARQQDDTASTYARKLEKSEALIDWRQDAHQINRTIRAGIGRNPAFSLLDGERVRFLRATVSNELTHALPGTILPGISSTALRIACTRGVLNVTDVQLPGKNPNTVRDILNARAEQFTPGKRFVSDESADS
jgi:methionyl-tRNA formyltransferase